MKERLWLAARIAVARTAPARAGDPTIDLEVAGRSGFAHLFEHVMVQGSGRNRCQLR